MSPSKIEWTDATWNPLAGCSPVSPGCTHCYAATMARRLEAMGRQKYKGTAERRGRVDVFTGRINLDEQALTEPFRWKKPRMVFVNSMSDLFHEAVPFEFINRVFAVMALCQRHTFQVLTKRPERMADYFKGTGWAPRAYVTDQAREFDNDPGGAAVAWPLPNVWLGTSVEDQERADQRIPLLLQCPAAVRFLSCEPLLGPVDLLDVLGLGIQGIGWVIAGGESGHGARACDVSNIRSIVRQCRAAGVPCFVKQLGSHVIHNGCSRPGGHWPERTKCEDTGTGHFRVSLKDSKGGDSSEWPDDLRIQEFPERAKVTV